MPITATRARMRDELRQTILDEADMLLREKGRDALTMRKLATRLGCSPMAIYNYFDDKQALEHAVAAQAFAKLAERASTVTKKRGIAGIREILIAYVAAAREDPAQYRALFMTPPPIDAAEKTRDSLQEDNPAFRLLSKRVATCIEKGQLKGDAFALTTVLWTAAHGAATAIITYTKYPFGSWEAYAAAMIDTILAGAQHHAVTDV
jgi:AcrR family transcriptional regulator